MFESAYEYMLPHEINHQTRKSNDKDDPGGFTSMGISLRFLKSTGSKYCPNNTDAQLHFLSNLTDEQAQNIYRKEFWSEHYELIKDVHIRNYIFDMCVNSGTSEAIKITQRAVNWFRADVGLNPVLTVDGVFGKGTLENLNNAMPVGKMLGYLQKERINFYYEVIKNHPSETKFLDDWIRRAKGE